MDCYSCTQKKPGDSRIGEDIFAGPFDHDIKEST